MHVPSARHSAMTRYGSVWQSVQGSWWCSYTHVAAPGGTAVRASPRIEILHTVADHVAHLTGTLDHRVIDGLRGLPGDVGRERPAREPDHGPDRGARRHRHHAAHRCARETPAIAAPPTVADCATTRPIRSPVE